MIEEGYEEMICTADTIDDTYSSHTATGQRSPMVDARRRLGQTDPYQRQDLLTASSVASEAPISDRQTACLKRIQTPVDNLVARPIDEAETEVNLPSCLDVDTFLDVGTLFAERYEVLHFIAKGGMGQLYCVQDRFVNQIRAIKILPHASDPNDIQRKRFFQEYQTLAELNHPGLVRVYESGMDGEAAYYTMDFLSGGTLRSVLSSFGSVHWLWALSIIEILAESLSYLHANEILHRDIKAENILFSSDGAPVLADFGLAIRIGWNPTERLTGRGFFIGSCHYMAPEQAISPDQLDERCDIYALGTLLYELLTGSVPFAHLPGEQALRKKLENQSSLLPKMLPGIPSVVLSICSTAMAFDRKKRFGSMKELKTHVRFLLDSFNEYAQVSDF